MRVGTLKMESKTNYCTFSPDWIGKYYIGECCKLHDVQYRKAKKSMTRKEADLMFLYFLMRKLPRYLYFIAYLYYFAVRLFTGPSWKRWEYRWYFGFIPIRRKNE